MLLLSARKFINPVPAEGIYEVKSRTVKLNERNVFILFVDAWFFCVSNNIAHQAEIHTVCEPAEVINPRVVFLHDIDEVLVREKGTIKKYIIQKMSS